MKLMLREQRQQPTTPDYYIESIRGRSALGNEKCVRLRRGQFDRNLE